MKNKYTLGTIIFGIVFVLAALAYMKASSGFMLAYTGKNSLLVRQYLFRVGQLKGVEKAYKTSKAKLLKSGKAKIFEQRLQIFKKETAQIRERYLVPNRIPRRVNILISLGFLLAVFNVITALGLFLSRPWARRLALGAAVLAAVHYLLSVVTIFSALSSLRHAVVEAWVLGALLNPHVHPISFSFGNVIYGTFFSPVALGRMVLSIIFVGAIFFYFSCPHVKEMFD